MIQSFHCMIVTYCVTFVQVRQTSFLGVGQRGMNSPYRDEIHLIRMRILGILYMEKKAQNLLHRFILNIYKQSETEKKQQTTP